MPQRGTNPLRDANLKPSVASSAEGFLVPKSHKGMKFRGRRPTRPGAQRTGTPRGLTKGAKRLEMGQLVATCPA